MLKTAARDNPCYCINFRRAANTLTKFYDRAFAPLDLTTNQFSLLCGIQALGACNKSELAQHSRLDRTTIIRSLAILREKGLIEDTTEIGTRNRGIRLTGAGESAVAKGRTGWKLAQEQVRSLIGEDRLLAMQQVFADIERLDGSALRGKKNHVDKLLKGFDLHKRTPPGRARSRRRSSLGRLPGIVDIAIL